MIVVVKLDRHPPFASYRQSRHRASLLIDRRRRLLTCSRDSSIAICYYGLMADPRVALYVRIPPDQARRLDERARTLNRAKQDVVTDLITGCLDQVEDVAPSVAHADRPSAAVAADVMTAEELADFLRSPESSVIERARLGELPGRKIGGEWRFARHAVLEWLEGTDGAKPGPGFGKRS